MENKRKKLSLKILLCIIIGMFLTGTQVYANNNELDNLVKIKEYTQEYLNWLELSEDEKNGLIEPRKYDVEYETNYSTYLKGINNKIKVFELLKSSSDGTYDLRKYIPNNVKVRNQLQTNTCWAFAGIGVLESNLALKDYKNNITGIEYDFSERHMAYSTAKKSLLNSESYEYGYNLSISSGGNYYMAQQYLTTGNGAISEDDMIFVNTEESIDISDIQNKEVSTTLLDTTIFATNDQTTTAELITEMKSHITNYGGIYAGIYGAKLLSNNYNNVTGAIYTDNTITTPMNHAAIIIGWNDYYDKNNFNFNCRPTKNGAWIIKNSWGEVISTPLSEAKETFWASKETYFKENYGYNSAEDIPNDHVVFLLALNYGDEKVSINEEKQTVDVEVGNKGYMYVSYEDANIYRNLWGIENSKPIADYDNIYQHDELGYSAQITLPVGTEKPAYMANVFSRDTKKYEQLTKISLNTLQEYTCKVYVNANGKNLDELQEVELAEGETVNIKPGYHTIEFAKPIELTGDSFAVVVEVMNNLASKKIAIEYPTAGTSFENVVVNSGESFYSTDMNNWVDVTTKSFGNVTIKAFTDDIPELQEIIIEKEPKVTYFEGEDFDSTGMIVKAIYDDTTEKEITDYTITDGENLQFGQNTVTISYTERGITKTVILPITVQKIELQEIQITQVPKKVTYFEGENFDATEMKVKAIYNNTEEKEINNYEITNGTNLQLGQNSVTISYTEGAVTRTTTQAITVQEKIEEEKIEVSKIEITTKPSKLEYIKNVEELSLNGGKITVTYTNNDTQLVDMTNPEVTATGFDNTQVGKNTITVIYANKTAVFDVQIIEAPTPENPEEPQPEQPETEKKEPILSNFKDTDATLTEFKMSYENNEGYYVITLNIKGIKIEDKESTHKYYWYLSGTQGDKNIPEKSWIEINSDKIKKQSDGTYTIDIQIDSRKVSNINEIAESDNLYLYIKEIATIDNNKISQIITKLVKSDVQVEEDTSDKIDNTLNNNEIESNDETTSQEKLPNAGLDIKMIILVIGIVIIARFSYWRFKNIDK